MTAATTYYKMIADGLAEEIGRAVEANYGMAGPELTIDLENGEQLIIGTVNGPWGGNVVNAESEYTGDDDDMFETDTTEADGAAVVIHALAVEVREQVKRSQIRVMMNYASRLGAQNGYHAVDLETLTVTECDLSGQYADDLNGQQLVTDAIRAAGFAPEDDSIFDTQEEASAVFDEICDAYEVAYNSMAQAHIEELSA